MKKLPKISNIKTIAKTKLFEVQKLDIEFSNGEIREYERLTPHKGSAVLVIAIEKDYVYLVNEYCGATEIYERNFPKGKVDKGETPEEAAVRELQEEIGLKPNNIKFIRTVYSSTGYMASPMHIFIAQDLIPSVLEGDEPEPLEIIKYPLNRLENLLGDKNFNESKNLVALNDLIRFLKTNSK
ncbi:MAG: ADP compounds hydrolase NudE [Psittacicella sp.]